MLRYLYPKETWRESEKSLTENNMQVINVDIPPVIPLQHVIRNSNGNDKKSVKLPGVGPIHPTPDFIMEHATTFVTDRRLSQTGKKSGVSKALLGKAAAVARSCPFKNPWGKFEVGNFFFCWNGHHWGMSCLFEFFLLPRELKLFAHDHKNEGFHRLSAGTLAGLSAGTLAATAGDCDELN